MKTTAVEKTPAEKLKAMDGEIKEYLDAVDRAGHPVCWDFVDQLIYKHTRGEDALSRALESFDSQSESFAEHAGM